MTKREEALNKIKYAGYHEDSAAFVDLYISNRISYAAAIEAYRKGYAAKQNGMQCNCYQCQEKKGQ